MIGIGANVDHVTRPARFYLARKYTSKSFYALLTRRAEIPDGGLVDCSHFPLIGLELRTFMRSDGSLYEYPNLLISSGRAYLRLLIFTCQIVTKFGRRIRRHSGRRREWNLTGQRSFGADKPVRAPGDLARAPAAARRRYSYIYLIDCAVSTPHIDRILAVATTFTLVQFWGKRWPLTVVCRSYYAERSILFFGNERPPPPGTNPRVIVRREGLPVESTIKNIFSNWLEEKVDLPIFDGISQVSERADAPAPQPHLHSQSQVAFAPVPLVPVAYGAPPQPPRTEELLREFETVLQSTSVELTHLTPPQSPPGPATQLLLSYAQQAHCVPLVPANVPVAPAGTWSLGPMTQPAHVSVTAPLTVECELEEVEKLVRDRAAQLASPPPSVGSSSFSPRSSPSSSPRSSSTDEDWSVCGVEARSRPKPYSRSLDDRRSRKKEQNKNAATRYRQKKKAEVEVLLSEERSLRQRHTELGNKCADLQREIRYLKGLMRDLFKAKGLIK
ncbi:Activating transcription factor of chaperone [Eumeta japonica]|uniref:Activating transcription factor of chaperone n=1 Tax=Eumeta variegata TaxID=151549 RepID=A0A4C1TLE2_EUMVA|nr:Activating transcription factor of chaperone [Eumeta japonica]